MCDCKFDIDLDDPDEDTEEETWHYKRTCLHCGFNWHGLHCIHDGYQNPCHNCGVIPTPVQTSSTVTT